MKILFAGTTTHAAQVLQHLHTSLHQVVAVLTREDAPAGRNRKLTASPVAQLAEKLQLPIIKSNCLGQETNDEIKRYQPDLGVVIAFGALLKIETLAIPKHGWLNLHYSLLPKWRGAAPVQHTLLAGESITGVTIFKLDEGMDSGPVLAKVETPVQPSENSADLLSRLTLLGISLLDESLARIEAGIANYIEQSGQPSIATKIQRLDAQINWNEDALQLDRLVRAMNPEPMAWSIFGDSSIRVVSARLANIEANEKIGTVFLNENNAYVSCGNRSVLQLLEVQPSGKNRMKAVDWLRGQHGQVVLGG